MQMRLANHMQIELAKGNLGGLVASIDTKASTPSKQARKQARKHPRQAISANKCARVQGSSSEAVRTEGGGEWSGAIRP